MLCILSILILFNSGKKIIRLINRLVDIAISESDHASNIFLQWFVTEQVQEEMNADGFPGSLVSLNVIIRTIDQYFINTLVNNKEVLL